MTTLQTIQEIAKDGAALLGSLSVLATALSHFPFPAKVAQFFARIGLSTARFSVNLRPTAGPVTPL